jgi:sugar phosphate permease
LHITPVDDSIENQIYLENLERPVRKSTTQDTSRQSYRMTELDQKQHRIFYGWWIVGALFFIAAYTAGIAFFCFTAILDPIASEFGWSYAQISFAASLRGIETGLLSPLVGWLIDRWGPRKLLISGVTIVGIGLFLLSRVNSLAAFYGTFILISIGLSACTNLLTMTVVGYWFKRRVSITTGIVVSGTACGALLVPLVTQIIDTHGWRMAMIFFGIGAIVILIPVSLLVRHKPEQYGYLPDGDTAVEQASEEEVKEIPDADIDVKQVVKGSIFWHIGIASTCHLLVVNAMITHIMPYLRTAGIERSLSSLVASIIPITSILGRLSFGWFGDRFDKRWVMASGFALLSISMLVFNSVASTGIWLIVPFIILCGFGYGGPIPLVAAVIREYFGRRRLGTILGFVMGVTMFGSMVGPPLAGWIFDTFDSYRGAWFACAGIAAVSLISIITIPSKSNAIKTAHSV